MPYYVSLAYVDSRLVEGKGVGRKVRGRMQEACDNRLAIQDLTYDGEKSLLPSNKVERTIIFEDVTSNNSNGHRSLDGHGGDSFRRGESVRGKNGWRTNKGVAR